MRLKVLAVEESITEYLKGEGSFVFFFSIARVFSVSFGTGCSFQSACENVFGMKQTYCLPLPPHPRQL